MWQTEESRKLSRRYHPGFGLCVFSHCIRWLKDIAQVPLDPSPGTRQGIINEKGDLSCPQSMFAISAASTNRWRSKVFAVSSLRGDFLRLDAEFRRVAAHPVCPPRAHGADFLRIPRSYFPGPLLLSSQIRFTANFPSQAKRASMIA